MRGPILVGERAVVLHVTDAPTTGEPERRAVSAIGAAMAEARRFTSRHPGFKAAVLWRGHGQVCVQGGEVYRILRGDVVREFARGVA